MQIEKQIVFRRKNRSETMKKSILLLCCLVLLLSCFTGCNSQTVTSTDVTPVDSSKTSKAELTSTVSSKEDVSAPQPTQSTPQPTQSEPPPTQSEPQTEVSPPAAQPKTVSFDQHMSYNDGSYLRNANREMGAFAVLCRTYQELVDLLDSQRLCFFDNGYQRSIVLEQYSKSYFESGNALLLYYLHSTSSSRTILVEGMTFEEGTLHVVLHDRQNSLVTYDAIEKVYVVELPDFSENVNKIHVTSEVFVALLLEDGKGGWQQKTTEEYDFAID